MNISQLQTFIDVIDSGSIQGAAHRLAVSRSSLRRSIDALEADVGTPLLHRDVGGVRLTPAGSVLLLRARPLISSARDLVQEALGAAGVGTGVMRSFEPVGIPVSLRSQALLATRAALPNLRIVARQVEDPLSHAMDPLELLIHEGEPPDRHNWHSQVLVRVPLRVLASRAYLERAGTPRVLADLASHEILMWLRPRQPEDSWPLLDGGSVLVQPALSSPDLSLLLSIADGGGGLLLAPDVPQFDDLRSAPLETVLDELVGEQLVVRVSSPHRVRSDSRTRDALALMFATLDMLSQE